MTYITCVTGSNGIMITSIRSFEAPDDGAALDTAASMYRVDTSCDWRGRHYSGYRIIEHNNDDRIALSHIRIYALDPEWPPRFVKFKQEQQGERLRFFKYEREDEQ